MGEFYFYRESIPYWVPFFVSKISVSWPALLLGCILKNRTLTVPHSRRRQNQVTKAKNSQSLNELRIVGALERCPCSSTSISRHHTSSYIRLLGVPLGSKPSQVLTALVHLRHSATGPAATRRHSPRGRSQILSFNVFIDSLSLRKAAFTVNR